MDEESAHSLLVIQPNAQFTHKGMRYYVRIQTQPDKLLPLSKWDMDSCLAHNARLTAKFYSKSINGARCEPWEFLTSRTWSLPHDIEP